MAAGRELFRLWGVLGVKGITETNKGLKKIDRQARATQRSFTKLGNKVSKIGRVLTKSLTLPLLAAAAASVKFIDDATDLNETISKTGEIFGSSAKDIEAWAEKSATSIGQSKQQAMDAASTFAIFAGSTGMAGDELVKFSTELVELSSDMASFFNTEPEDAITAIGAAFRGETEPIRRYGVMLDDATMRAKALEMGLVTSTKKALMPQTKVLTAHALILEKTTKAQGDFARTSAGLANQKRILAAQMKNVSATAGQIFLPLALKIGKVLSKTLGIIEQLVDWWKKLDDRNKSMIKGFLLITAAIGPVVFLIGKLILLGKILVPLLIAIKGGVAGISMLFASLGKSVMGMTLLIAALVAVGWYWYNQWDALSSSLKVIWAKIQEGITEAANSINQAVYSMVLGMIDGLSGVAKLVPGLTEKFRQAKIETLKLSAASWKTVASAKANTFALADQVVETKSLLEVGKDVKKQIEDGLGLKDEDINKTKEKTQLTQAEIEAQKALAAAEKQRLEDKLAFEEDFDRKLQDMRLGEQELLMRDMADDLVKAEELGAEKLKVVEFYMLKEKEMRDKIREEEAAADKAKIQDRLGTAQKIGGKINGIMGKFAANELKRLDIKEKKEIQAIENSQMTEEAKQAAIQKIQERTDKQRRKLEREAAIREKLFALFEIGINTASAIIKALPNIPLSIAVGAIGAAEAVAVASAPLPFAEGGLIRGTQDGVNAIVGEADQDEVVFPLEKGIELMTVAFC